MPYERANLAISSGSEQCPDTQQPASVYFRFVACDLADPERERRFELEATVACLAATLRGRRVPGLRHRIRERKSGTSPKNDAKNEDGSTFAGIRTMS